MGNKEILSILFDWNFWEKDLDTGIRRGKYLNNLTDLLSSGQIVMITGARRSGKSYLMRQLAQKLIGDGVGRKNILMINFEDPRFVELNTSLLQQVYEIYLETFSPNKTPYILLDEVQEVDGWEKWVRTMHELKKANIIISGSNSKLLSHELSSVLTGRHLDMVVFPLSFQEFLQFNQLQVKNETGSIKNRIQIKSLINNYIEFGSFPKVAIEKQKKEILLTYFEDVINRDLIKRYKVRKPERLKSLAKFYLSNVSCLISFNSLEKSLEISADTIEKFSSYFENTYLNFFLKRFSFKIKDQEKSQRKVYAIDTGLANAVGFRFSENMGRLAENLIFLHLLRKKALNPHFDFYYWKDTYGWEVDFIIREELKITSGLQVCWDISHPQTKNREIKSLLKAMNIFKLDKGVVITQDSEGEEIFKKKKIRFIPLWKWLLDLN